MDERSRSENLDSPDNLKFDPSKKYTKADFIYRMSALIKLLPGSERDLMPVLNSVKNFPEGAMIGWKINREGNLAPYMVVGSFDVPKS